MRSIRRQLLVWLLAGVLIAGVAAAFALYSQARREIDELFDYQLRQLAVSLRDRPFDRFEVPAGQLAFEFDFVIQVWSPNGMRLYISHPGATPPGRSRLGYDTVATRDGQWRVYSVRQRGVTFQVAQPLAVRGRLAREAALRTLVPFLLLVPVLGAIVWIGVGRSLRPLDAVARAVETRTPSSLEPLHTADLPAEVQPLVASLNDLLRRLEHALASQREFIADAAHELRSPLTALRLQIQLAERAETEPARGEALRALHGGVERATHVVQQLLTLARQEPSVRQRPFEPVRLDELARQVVGEHHLQAEEGGVDLGLVRDEPVQVPGDREALHVLLRNLVDNAVRYTPEGGRVDVSVRADGAQAQIEVLDTGPGIPPDERERVFDRFYRRSGTTAPGTGLGLAIVREIAESHSAKVELLDGVRGPGLRVRVTLPSASVVD